MISHANASAVAAAQQQPMYYTELSQRNRHAVIAATELEFAPHPVIAAVGQMLAAMIIVVSLK